MTEELQARDLELKELFTAQKLEELVEELNQESDLNVVEMTEMNLNVVKKYFDQKKIDLLRQHLTFVAYVSFLTEYSGQRKLYEESEYQEKFSLFEQILSML